MLVCVGSSQGCFKGIDGRGDPSQSRDRCFVEVLVPLRLLFSVVELGRGFVGVDSLINIRYCRMQLVKKGGDIVVTTMGCTAIMLSVFQQHAGLTLPTEI